MRNLGLTFIAITLLTTCSKPPEINRPVSKKETTRDVEKGTGDAEQTPETNEPTDTDSGRGDESPAIDPGTSDPGSDPVKPIDPGASDSGSDPVKPIDPVVPSPTLPDPMIPTPVPDGAAEMKGHLDISFTMVGPASAGPFRSRGHVRAVWITDSKNAYLRTLDYHASRRAQYLKRFNSFTSSTIDGSSGATDKSLGTPLSTKISWDLKGKDGKTVLAGSYKIWFEMAEANVAGNITQPVDGKQTFDTSSGYAYHIIPVTIDEKTSRVMDSKSPVFTSVNILRRLD